MASARRANGSAAVISAIARRRERLGQGQAAGELSRDKLTDMLLAIVEEKTGYPRDMVGLDQSLESDLGIDSIKRIEVVGAMLQALPERYREALSASRSKLNTQATLEGMLSMMSAAGAEGAASVPFEVAGTETQAVQSLPSRHVVAAEAESIDASALRRITPGHFLITEDTLGLATQVASLLMDRGCTSTLIGGDVLASEERLAAWIAGPGAGLETIAGVVHLRSGRRRLGGRRRALVHLARAALPPREVALHPVARIRREDGRTTLTSFRSARSAAASAATPASPRGLSLQGGGVGLLKSLREERPTLRVKAVDVDPDAPLSRLAAELMQELELVGGRQEVGYPGGVRTVFRTVAAPSSSAAVPREKLDALVVLATGGARGITAETLRELALPGNVLILTGRSPLVDEPEALAACGDAEQVRQHFIAQVRSGAAKLTPADIQRKTAAVMAGREMRANIDDFRRRGATVEYHVVDVLDECALAHLIADVESRYAPINGVVHGAGVIEDKLLADKTSESWSRVVETKVLGLLLLQRHLKPQSLRFLSVFSSVAGRFGNSGQSDYATANELMNRLCCQLRDQWRGQVEVSALCWGPWGPTQFGAGMVTAETEAKFAAKGVTLVSAAAGRQLFVDAVARAPGGAVEIVCGQGPWEAHEAAVGAIERAAPMALADLLGPIIGPAVVTTLPTGEQLLAVQHRRPPPLPRPASHRRRAGAARGGGDGDHGRRGANPVAGMEGRRDARLPADQGRRDEGRGPHPAGRDPAAALRQQRRLRGHGDDPLRSRRRPLAGALPRRRPPRAAGAGRVRPQSGAARGEDAQRRLGLRRAAVPRAVLPGHRGDRRPVRARLGLARATLPADGVAVRRVRGARPVDLRSGAGRCRGADGAALGAKPARRVVPAGALRPHRPPARAASAADDDGVRADPGARPERGPRQRLLPRCEPARSCC